ncbi:MAG: AAA family ATPase [Bryobacteraceae bacterium]
MSTNIVPPKRVRRRTNAAPAELIDVLSRKVVGQNSAVRKIIPFVQMHQAGLAPEGRPVGNFLLLGPTGTGKTRTVEALAESLHGSAKHMIRVDCGEFQMEHEVAKLVGAPPGYLGHRETHPMLSQAKLASVTTEGCDLSIVLFDEIEKAAPSMTRLLLGVLDKANLRLGDNNLVNFERSLIFLTSNLGAKSMMREMTPAFGFARNLPHSSEDQSAKLESIATAAVRRQFSPEFLNRIDATLTYQPLSQESLSAILNQQLVELQNHIIQRLRDRAFRIEVPEETRRYLLSKGTSIEYGAREIKRIIHRKLSQPLAALVAEGRIPPGARIVVEIDSDRTDLELKEAA